MDKWDERFLRVAQEVATWSKDPSTKVGCVLVNLDRHIIATGYNGFPRGVCDHAQRYEDRSVKYLMVQHAEANAVLQAVADMRSATAYVTHRPCAGCSGILIQAGITRVVSYHADGSFAERFADSFKASETMFAEAGVTLDLF